MLYGKTIASSACLSEYKASPTKEAFYEESKKNAEQAFSQRNMQNVWTRFDEMQSENARVIEFLFSEIDKLKEEISALKTDCKPKENQA